MHCQVEMRGCPSPKLAQLLAALSLSKPGATYPSACPLFSRISKRRRGVSFCRLLQLPGLLTSPRHLNPNAASAAAPPAPTRAKFLVRSAQQLPELSAAQLSPSHSLPSLLPLLLSYKKLSIGRAALHARNVTRPGPELHEESRQWLKERLRDGVGCFPPISEGLELAKRLC